MEQLYISLATLDKSTSVADAEMCQTTEALLLLFTVVSFGSFNITAAFCRCVYVKSCVVKRVRVSARRGKRCALNPITRKTTKTSKYSNFLHIYCIYVAYIPFYINPCL